MKLLENDKAINTYTMYISDFFFCDRNETIRYDKRYDNDNDKRCLRR